MFSTFANPHRFMALSKWLLPVFAGLGIVMLASGWVWAIFFVPEEQYQGATARIMYIHVPAAMVSMAAYATMAVGSLLYLTLKHTLADVAAKSAAPTAAALSFICLITGALWGRPTWGTYWVWDARLTSMLFQLFLILGYMALRSAFQREQDAARAGAILCLVGAVNLPIIKFSVDWWNTLHQPAGFITMSGSSLAGEFFWPLLYNLFAVMFVFGALLMAAMRADIQNRQYEAKLARLNRSGS
ncbi:heme ABC transporter permease CcmC [Ponticaulis sp.]|uniref:heme ABC transporter permease CcmC n=1 Tax=Ponticaulis sp. TaxID=2020902 RepID=UPI000C6178C7|nr:heme ABC transporter permease CcmC [Ponticaulis sp.]MAJ10341.1 heme transporter HemC [Ponticaulis sp.]HBH89678.1 heme transporter HemC [Hyphomonadaceae bacterium]|tara:strand:- start:7370 stop:8098 length:729 start_codon:yes stop_codon:yes gene_type:complete